MNTPTSDLERTFSRHLTQEAWNDAVHILVEGYGPEVLRFLHGFLRDQEAAQEVFAQVCLQLCEIISSFRGQCPGRTWFYYQARFAALAWIRQRDKKRRHEQRLQTQDLSRMSQLIEKVRSQTRPYLKTSVKDQFQTIQQQLTPQERMLLVLYKYQGMNSQQVAEAMSSPDEIWTRTMVRKRWQRLKQKIADIAQQRGLLEQETDLPEQ